MHIQYEDVRGLNPFLDEYINADDRLMSFYDYGYDDESIKKRAKELAARSFNRGSLKDVLYSFNKKMGAGEETFTQIGKLTSERSLMIVGGQQAGLFTGPLYTVHKVISILAHADKAEKDLGLPVIPLFWIAGEDHDIDEINHIFVYYKQDLKRFAMKERNDLKIPASNRNLNREEAKKVLLSTIRHLQETQDTKIIASDWGKLIDESKTYVDFFGKLIHHLFKGTGIVLMDAQDEAVRKLERPFFNELIERNGKLRLAFEEQAKRFKTAGFGEPVSIDPRLSHLFLDDHNERTLLYSDDQEGAFTNKEKTRSWTIDELHHIAETDPAKLSNNVVSRPVMQEWLLPVLGFISGAGEIKYWGTLSSVFREFDFKIPPLIPRMQFTLVDRGALKRAGKRDLSIRKTIEQGASEKRDEWYGRNRPADYDPVFEKAEEEFESLMEKMAANLREHASTDVDHERFQRMGKGVLDRYKRQVDRQVNRTLAPSMNHFNYVNTVLRPQDGLQERTINVLPFLNGYGTDVIRQLTARVLENGPDPKKHTVVIL
ncbi:bacillithiol biosynthesis cysteine-adding enzyme BshC [Alteribacter keqinensis]|uniref:Putative cysteine ligase BshC n=1 Tax=Alteribacter keqinensis TaxID=2483800 RepID=A0A3M7TVW9_9BACI|nr:bacillithiol biosynthesis cysteine-adding enzyme BshC [Alteribacter keqinensis]RNA69696.1 bacillithiol biosynthesis cysteine-adding enzyme BshC [Alteribacter keqinensis]